MVEFAIVVSLLLVLVLGFFEIGRALFHHNLLNEAVEVGARYLARQNGAVSVADPPPGCDTDAPWDTVPLTTSTENLISQQLPASLQNLAVLIDLTPDYVQGGAGSSTEVDACVIRVDVAADYVPIVGVIPGLPFTGDGMALNFRISAASEERFIGQ